MGLIHLSNALVIINQSNNPILHTLHTIHMPIQSKIQAEFKVGWIIMIGKGLKRGHFIHSTCSKNLFSNSLKVPFSYTA